MAPSNDRFNRVTIVAVTLALVIWALFGLADLRNRPYAGFSYGPDAIVNAVEEGGPADQAGIRAGDRIISINGVPLSETALVRSLPRAGIGETRPVVVERTDQDSGMATKEEMGITYSSEFAAQRVGVIGGAILGVVFLLCGALAYLRAPSLQALLFGIVGICLAWLLLPDPHLATHGLRSFLEAVKFLAAFPVFACLLHLTMVFPEPRRIVKRKAVVAAIYLPAIPLGAAGAIQIVQRGQPGPAVVGIGTPVLVVYMLLSMIALIHRYATATRETRVAYGLSLLVWGVLIGFGPLAVSAVAFLVAPSMPLPGSDYYFLAMVLIPVSFAAALWRWSAHAEGGTTEQPAGA